MLLDNILPFAQHSLARCIQPGDCVVDGTAGNGHDTAFLAQCVGETGRVFAFDVQQTALDSCAHCLNENGMLSRVTLIHDGHEHMAAHVPMGIRAVMFNFGYLPGGDKSHTTQAETSVAALQAALALLSVGGIISAVLYPGHTAGALEAAAIENWVATLPQQQVAVLQYRFINRRHAPPYALLLEKIASSSLAGAPEKTGE